MFEVLARNRQSDVELFGRTKSAREQPHRVFTIPPRQQLSSPTRLAIRRWKVARATSFIITIAFLKLYNLQKERDIDASNKRAAAAAENTLQ
jgi:hypothetical protein